MKIARLPLIAIALALIVNPAAADPVLAEALFREGRELARQERWEAACQKFAESQRLEPALGTRLNLAHCEEKIGRIAQAWQDYRAALDALPSDDERAPGVRERITELERRVPRLTLVLKRGVSGARVLRDGTEVGNAALSTPLPVDPGEHVVEVTAPNRQPRRYVIRLAERETKQLEIEPGAESAAPIHPTQKPRKAAQPPPGDAERDDRGDSRRTWAWVAGGVGIAGLAVGASTGAWALSKKDAVEQHCDDDLACDSTGLDAARDGKRLAVVSSVAFAVGVAALGTSAVLFLTSDERGQATIAVTGQF